MLTSLFILLLQPVRFDPVARYDQEAIEGFTILVNRSVVEQLKDWAETRTELSRQLRVIVEVMPRKPLESLRNVPIWIEWKAKPQGAAEFHVSAGFLREHGYNPLKLNCVEICNCRNFVAWSRSAQPMMVLHELAHAYHFRELGAKHEGIHAAYRQALERKIYDQVDYVLGGRKRAYALQSAAEYFAELSETYFGKNDFYPYKRADLEKHDPAGYTLMQTVWGEPRGVAK